MSQERSRAIKPFGHTAIAKFLEEKIDAVKEVKTQRVIAEEVGFKTPNMISMLKNGDSKVPLDKIALLAQSLNVDAGHLLRLGLEQYWTGLGSTIDQIFGNIASANECDLFLIKWREVTKNLDPAPSSSVKSQVYRMIVQIADSI